MSQVIGVIVGDSAYEIAQENGFVGTEAEWVESLHGKSSTIEIGNVTSEGNQVSVTNTGTDTNAIFNFNIPNSNTNGGIPLSGQTVLGGLYTYYDEAKNNLYQGTRPITAEDIV